MTMIVESLPRIETPAVERPKPCACGVFVAECLVPRGDSAIALCWICAHDYTEHERPPGAMSGTPCDCSPEDVYPSDVLEFRSRNTVARG